MNVKGFLQHLGFEITQAGSQLQVDCPNCDDNKKHLYLAPGNGVGFCHKCSWAPNPYKLAEKVTNGSRAEIMKLLEEFGLNNSVGPSTPLRSAQDKLPEKKLALRKEDIRDLTDDEKQSFCDIKQIDIQAFEKFKPYGHKTKPWVLLPAYDPNETNKACGWMRCALNGEPIELDGGKKVKYPIIAGSRHGLFGLPQLLKDDPEKIVFVEAWRDMAACLSIGLNATASSGGASTWNDDWLSFFKDKIVYICMDADIPGQRAAQRAAERIYTVAKEVYIVNLPYEITKDHGKDVNDYITEHGKDFLLLLSKAKKFVPGSVIDDDREKIVLANGFAQTIATALDRHFREAEAIYRHYNYQGLWCEFTGTGYELREYVDMQNKVWRFAARCVVPGKKKGEGLVDLNCSEHMIKNALSAMGSFEGVDIPSAIVAPAWLDGRDGPKPEYVIAVGNGLLDVSAKPVLIEHTKVFLNFNLLPYDYDPKARCPWWEKFLGSVFEVEQLSSTKTRFDEEAGDFVEVEESVPDAEKIGCLQEWFGLLLTSEMKYHKILGIIGPKRSGKGTIARVLTAMIGSNNVATPMFASLVESFGLQGLLNARVAIFGDANMDKDPVVVGRAVEKLKTISGEDGIDVNRKYEKYITAARLTVRFVMISNNLQRLTDPTGTISDRFIFLKTTQSYYGREDLGLENRLMAELPGILNWSLEGLDRLTKRGYIAEPPESAQMRTQSKEIGSNIIAFVNTGCSKGEGLYTEPDDMYDAFKRWCDADGSQPMKKRAFRQEFGEAFPEHACSKHRVEGHENPVWVYWNIAPHVAQVF